jgi:DNA (cytosine-5)-methyltransferase 1
MRHGSLFSGIGGFDLAAEWMGWENVFHCEWNPFGQKVLHHYWPQAIQYHDITKTDFTIHRGGIDILTGGFPCQPYSMAGKRLGKEDERHLWPEMLRAIREIAPRYVVGENVLGLTNWNGGLVFDEVHSDLEAAGYEVQAVVIPAAAVNAPHGRDRVWFVAKNTMRSGCTHREFEQERTGVWKQRNVSTGSADGVCLSEGLTSDTEGEQGKWLRSEQREFSDTQQGQLRRSSSGLGDGLTADTGSRRMEGYGRKGKREQLQAAEFNEDNSQQFRRMDWEKFPTQSPICGGDDGISRELDGITFPKWRNESIKAYGNAVCPQVVFQLFKAIENIT